MLTMKNNIISLLPIESFDASNEEELAVIDESYEHEYKPCENGKYYLGSYKYFPEVEEILLMKQISFHVFYGSHYNSLRNFIYWYSGTQIPDTRVQIMQVIEKQDEYGILTTAILKTHWIKLIQRTWKRILRERRTNKTKYPEMRGMLAFLRPTS
jgi:hypothetical protein